MQVPIEGAGLTPLSEVRVVQRNLAYVVGLSSACGREDLLRKREWFGGFGKTMKVAVAKSFGTAGGNQIATFAAYVTYKEKADAAEAIKAVNFGQLGLLLAKGGSGAGGSGETDIPRARASFGTTKYCAAWLRGQPCTKSNCLYLHAMAALTDCCTKDQLQRDRFDERFGLGKKNATTTTTTSAVNTAGMQPPEMQRSHSTPASYASTATAVANPIPTPKPLSFASVAAAQQQQAAANAAAAAAAAAAAQAADESVPNTDELSEFPPLQASPSTSDTNRSSKHASPVKQLGAPLPSMLRQQSSPQMTNPPPPHILQGPSAAEIARRAEEEAEAEAIAAAEAAAQAVAAAEAAAAEEAERVAAEEARNIAAAEQAHAAKLEALFTRPIHPISSLQPAASIPSTIGAGALPNTVMSGPVSLSCSRATTPAIAAAASPLTLGGLQPTTQQQSTIRPPPGFREKPLSSPPPGFGVPMQSTVSQPPPGLTGLVTSVTAVPLQNAPVVHNFPAIFSSASSGFGSLGGLNQPLGGGVSSSHSHSLSGAHMPLVRSNFTVTENPDGASWDEKYQLTSGLSNTSSSQDSRNGMHQQQREDDGRGNNWLPSLLNGMHINEQQQQQQQQHPNEFDSVPRGFGRPPLGHGLPPGAPTMQQPFSGPLWQPRQMPPTFSSMHSQQQQTQFQPPQQPTFSQHLQQQPQHPGSVRTPPPQSDIHSQQHIPSESPAKMRSRYGFAEPAQSPIQSQQSQQQQQQHLNGGNMTSWDMQDHFLPTQSQQQSQRPFGHPVSPPRANQINTASQFQPSFPPSQQQQQFGGFQQDQQQQQSGGFHGFMNQQPPPHQQHQQHFTQQHDLGAPPLRPGGPPGHLRPPLMSGGGNVNNTVNSNNTSSNSMYPTSSTPSTASFFGMQKNVESLELFSDAQGRFNTSRLDQLINQQQQLQIDDEEYSFNQIHVNQSQSPHHPHQHSLIHQPSLNTFPLSYPSTFNSRFIRSPHSDIPTADSALSDVHPIPITDGFDAPSDAQNSFPFTQILHSHQLQDDFSSQQPHMQSETDLSSCSSIAASFTPIADLSSDSSVPSFAHPLASHPLSAFHSPAIVSAEERPIQRQEEAATEQSEEVVVDGSMHTATTTPLASPPSYASVATVDSTAQIAFHEPQVVDSVKSHSATTTSAIVSATKHTGTSGKPSAHWRASSSAASLLDSSASITRKSAPIPSAPSTPTREKRAKPTASVVPTTSPKVPAPKQQQREQSKLSTPPRLPALSSSTSPLAQSSTPTSFAVVDDMESPPAIVKQAPKQQPAKQQQRRKKKQPIQQNRPSTPPPAQSVPISTAKDSHPAHQNIAADDVEVPAAEFVESSSSSPLAGVSKRKKKRGGKSTATVPLPVPASHLTSPATSYVLSTVDAHLPANAPVFVSPTVSPAAVISALATPISSHLTPAQMEAVASHHEDDPSMDAASTLSLDISSIHSELMHLAALVRAGALPSLELQQLLLSLVSVPGVPATVEQLMQHALAAQTDTEQMTLHLENNASEQKHLSVSKSVSGLAGGGLVERPPIIPYANLLALRSDASVAAAYDRAWRDWEQSTPFAQHLCREVYILQQRLHTQRYEERKLKQQLDHARDQLEAGLLACDEYDEYSRSYLEQHDDDDELQLIDQHQHDMNGADVTTASPSVSPHEDDGIHGDADASTASSVASSAGDGSESSIHPHHRTCGCVGGRTSSTNISAGSVSPAQSISQEDEMELQKEQQILSLAGEKYVDHMHSTLASSPHPSPSRAIVHTH
jgi:hypothetical protein